MIWTNLSRARVRLVCMVLGVALVALQGLGVGPAEARNPKLNVAVGQSITTRTVSLIKTVSIANTDVADVVVAGPQEILINGKAVGFTTLVVWDQNNVSTLYDVVVRGPFHEWQIELRVRVAELNKTRAFEYGMDWLWSDDRWVTAIFGGEVGTRTIPPPPFSPVAGAGEAATQTVAQQASAALRYSFGGTDVLSVIHALQADGVIKILAEPNVVAASGHQASFISGGEIPIPIVSGSGALVNTVTIQWKEYGVKVDFQPTIIDSGVVSLKVAPEVSQLDYQNGVQLSGFVVPAISKRRAETTVELEDGQVLVIGGLLLETENNVERKIPILGHIPLIGPLFFSNVQKMKTEQELLIVVSAHLIRALPKGTEVTLPGAVKEEG